MRFSRTVGNMASLNRVGRIGSGRWTLGDKAVDGTAQVLLKRNTAFVGLLYFCQAQTKQNPQALCVS